MSESQVDEVSAKKKPSLLLGQSFPNLAVLLLVGIAGYAGFLGGEYRGHKPFVAVAEKTSVVYSAVLDREDADEETLKKEVADPIIAVLDKYQKMGYVVIDLSKDDHGKMEVLALPDDVIDITSELRQAVTGKPAAPQTPQVPQTTQAPQAVAPAQPQGAAK